MDTYSETAELDPRKVEQFAGKIMQDIGGSMALLLSYMGDQTGVYRALRDTGRCDAGTLAEAAGVDRRYLAEWLGAQAAAGYVCHHEEDETFSMTPEQAIVLAQEGHPACLQGFVQMIVAQYATYEKAVEVFRSGAGRAWGDHHACCFCGTDRFFRPGYMVNLVDSWLPALDGAVAKLEKGAKVADIGCGLGSSTLLMAKAFPNSVFHGMDFHAASIEGARREAEETGLTANTRFTAVTAKGYDETGFDLACVFDALHDMGDPVGAARHIRESLKPDGTLMLVEPIAGDRLADNLNLIGQIFYSASTLVCTPASRAQEVGLALGAQAGEKRLAEVLRQAGFTRVRRAAETATNMVLEARP
ncbi:methyltransferase domain-containing protein [Skermanella rosea]|uniref:class I SAM-dependent methyltransferase n=1 Tax=Skermanella rosea TaxID=1817965 RepID=UPI001E538B76|nr:class I SAM-dependent methyltransferase [Skermanella rosea]UEM05485.1 methyltransferase domain-containing protein [Skermanella rosea]